MASPQVDKNFTRIANEILDKIMTVNLNGTQFRIVIAIWRYTYGFQGTKRELALTYIAKKINASKGQVNRELSTLIERRIISVYGIGPNGGRMLGFNKDYDKWDKQVPEEDSEGEKPKKPAKPLKYGEDNTYYKMALYFHGKVSAVAKEAGVEHLVARANLQSWADDFRKLMEIDQVDKRLARDVMDWVTQDSFWRTNVLSARKLREKFTELAIKMNALQKPKQKPIAHQRDIRDKEIEFQRWMQEGNDPDAFDWRN